MKAYKGFNRDLTCCGFQFEVGKTYHEEEAELCKSGFHACENPLDCFGYYAPGDSVYHEVELEEVSDERRNDTKLCGKTITIGAELSVAQICKLHFEYTSAKCTPVDGNVAKDFERCAASDDSSLAGGNWSSLAGGDGSSLAGGNWSSLAGGDDSSLAGGDRSSLAGGDMSTICARSGKVKGGVGSLLCCGEIGDDFKIIGFAAGIVDGENIKADTWYTVKNGKFVEAEGGAQT